MKDILNYLEQLDLSEIEAKLYLTLLKTGPISVRELAQKAGIHRTYGYVHINSLIDKELIVKLVYRSRKLIAASQPEDTLHHLVKEKVQRSKYIEKKLPDVIKALKDSTSQMKPAEEAEIKYFKGKNAAKRIYEEALKIDELRAYVKITETGNTEKLFPDNEKVFNDAFKKNKKLIVKEIVYDSFAGVKDAQAVSKNNRYFFKLMPGNFKWNITSEDILIYDDKVAIINYKEKISNIILQSIDYYNNSKELFDYIWSTLPEVNR